ncbi:FAD-binding oxidoreductase [Emcibacter sp. SYSU 3D8]|uniref:FAD-binding oxidoreductase n=1 Tax=Emcibacter sp. SYSU 3D8 TaxID=3133969 RepID=UPI0031FE8076
MSFAGWGNFPRRQGELETLRDPAAVRRAVLGGGPVLAHGAGRSYGDAALGAGRTLGLRGLDRFLAYDEASRDLTVEAGVMLSDVIDAVLPRGLFPPVVPGTRYVTIGGMVASNVHGKNHHVAGAFGAHVSALTLVTAQGDVVRCSRGENAQLFRATIGGMGLTGIVTDVTFRLIPVETAFIRQETLSAPDLAAAMRLLEESRNRTYSVAWIDGLGKGGLGRALVFRGEHALRADLDDDQARAPLRTGTPPRLAVPFHLPAFTLNRLSASAFNELYYRMNARREGMRVVGYLPYFFPLDGVAHWNRIYGSRGFIQHQCVIPRAGSSAALGEMLALIAREGNPSFLTVLKLLGPGDAGMIGFPMEGFTLAIDFPVSDDTLRLAAALDRIVVASGGRLYLAKDARQDRGIFDAGYGEADAFRAFRAEAGASARFRSLQSERLGL